MGRGEAQLGKMMKGAGLIQDHDADSVADENNGMHTLIQQSTNAKKVS